MTLRLFQLLRAALLAVPVLAGCQDKASLKGAAPAVIGARPVSEHTKAPPLQIDYIADVRDINWSADGKRIAAASADGTVSIWVVNDENRKGPQGPNRQTFGAPTAARSSIISDGQIIVEASGQKLRIREFATGRELQVLDQSEYASHSFFLAADGKKVLSFDSRRQEINVWDVQSGKLIDTVIPRSDSPIGTMLAVSRDGKMAYALAKGDRSGATFAGFPCAGVSTIDLATGATKLWIAHRFGKFEWPPIVSGDRIYIGNRAWNLATADELDRCPWEHPWLADPTGHFLVELERDSRFAIWDVQARRMVGRLPRLAVTLDGSEIAFSPDGRFLALSGRRKWTRGTYTHQGEPNPYDEKAYESTGPGQRVRGIEDRVLLVFDVSSQKRVRTLAYPMWPANSENIRDPEDFSLPIGKSRARIRREYFDAIGGYVWVDNNWNGIPDEGEKPVAGLELILERADGTEVCRTASHSDGEYQFNDVPPGNYRVRYGPHKELRPEYGMRTTRVIKLAAGQSTTAVNIRLGGQGHISGHAFWDQNGDGMWEGGHEPGWQDITVHLLDEENHVVKIARTNTYGDYQFLEVDPGRYRVQFVAPLMCLFSPALKGLIERLDSDVITPDGKTGLLTLASGGWLDGIDAGLMPFQPWFGPTPWPREVSGTVWIDEDQDGIKDYGEPGVADVEVRLETLEGQTLRTTKTDAMGKYAFKKAETGTYRVKFTLPTGYRFTLPHVGTDDSVDSDVIDFVNGRTGPIITKVGLQATGTDGGLIPLVPPTKR